MTGCDGKSSRVTHGLRIGPVGMVNVNMESTQRAQREQSLTKFNKVDSGYFQVPSFQRESPPAKAPIFDDLQPAGPVAFHRLSHDVSCYFLMVLLGR